MPKSSAVRFSSSGFVRPVRIRCEYDVGALLMLQWVAENASQTTLNISASSWRVDKWTVLRHVDCERGAAAIESSGACGALRQNLQLSLGLRLLLVVILEFSTVPEHLRQFQTPLLPTNSATCTDPVHLEEVDLPLSS